MGGTGWRSGTKRITFAAGCIVATLLFLTAVALAAGHALERVLTPRLSLWLNRAVGLFLIGFALKLAIDLLA